MVEVRALGPDDWRLWRELRLTALAEAPRAFTTRLDEWQGEGDREERWRARLGIPGCHLLAFVDGRPAGMAGGVPVEPEGTAELISMWVAPAVRGRGVGDRLIDAVERWAREVSARVLVLSVAEDNDAAVRLYRRAGFVRTGAPAERMPDGLRYQYQMAKPLPPGH